MDKNDLPRTYTIFDLAQILQVSVRTARRYITKGLIKPIHTEGKIRFSQAEIDRFLGVKNENND